MFKVQIPGGEGSGEGLQQSVFLTSSLDGPQPTFLRNTAPEGVTLLLCYFKPHFQVVIA